MKTHSRRRLTGAFTLVELMIVVAIIGLLASVAIPAYLRYVRQARTPEAMHNVRKLYDGLVSYFEVEHVSTAGTLLPKVFPVDTNWTPGATNLCPCGNPGGKCQPSDYPTAWNNPTFQALHFELHMPHTFSYGTQPFGNGLTIGDAYRVAAGADLDCDMSNGVTYVFRLGTRTSNGLEGKMGMENMLK